MVECFGAFVECIFERRDLLLCLCQNPPRFLGTFERIFCLRAKGAGDLVNGSLVGVVRFATGCGVDSLTVSDRGVEVHVLGVDFVNRLGRIGDLLNVACFLASVTFLGGDQVTEGRDL